MAQQQDKMKDLWYPADFIESIADELEEQIPELEEDEEYPQNDHILIHSWIAGANAILAILRAYVAQKEESQNPA